MPAAAAKSKLQDDPSTFPLIPAPVAIGEVLGKPPGAEPLPVPTTTIEVEADTRLIVPVTAAAGELVVENTLLLLSTALGPPSTVVEIVVTTALVMESLLDATTEEEEEATTLSDEEAGGGTMRDCELLLVEAAEAGGAEVETEAEVDAALEAEDPCEQGTTVVIVAYTVVAVAPYASVDPLG